MIKIITLILLLCGMAQAAPFAEGDAKTGKKLFDQFQCNRCHMGKMGGDGSAIFTRAERSVTHPEKLIPQIKVCSGMVGANLTPQQEQHLAAYLNQQYYKFK